MLERQIIDSYQCKLLLKLCWLQVKQIPNPLFSKLLKSKLLPRVISNILKASLSLLSVPHIQIRDSIHVLGPAFERLCLMFLRKHFKMSLCLFELIHEELDLPKIKIAHILKLRHLL